jgi:predicted dehydrogenase
VKTPLECGHTKKAEMARKKGDDKSCALQSPAEFPLMSRRTRRQFLEDSMFAAAAAVAAGSEPPVLAGERAGSRSALERLGVAVVGVRGRGSSHISAWAGRKDTEVLYVCDVDREVGQRRVVEAGKRQRGRVPRFEEDLRRVLEDPRVDVVSIATPNHWLALAAIWAMQAGKDVYLEKPVSHNVSEGRRIVQAARRYGRVCQAGMQCRSNRGAIDAMRYVHQGHIGQVRVARSLCYRRRTGIGSPGRFHPPASVNYDLWLGPAAMAPLTRPRFHHDWHWQWAYGNGDLGNQAIHQLDLARWSLGAGGLSRGVVSYGGCFGTADARETADTQVVIHDCGDAALVCEVRGLNSDARRGAKVGVIVEGTEGYLVMTSYSSGAVFDGEGNAVQHFSGGGDHFANFLRAVRTRRAGGLNADIEEGHLSSTLCHLGNISYRLGQPVAMAELQRRLDDVNTPDDAQRTFERTVRHLESNRLDVSSLPFQAGPWLAFDPTSETFRDSPEADQLLTRPYRQPFEMPAAGNV